MDSIYFKIFYALELIYILQYFYKVFKFKRNGLVTFYNGVIHKVLPYVLLVYIGTLLILSLSEYDITSYGVFLGIFFLIGYIFLGQIWYDNEIIVIGDKVFDINNIYNQVEKFIDEPNWQRIRVTNIEGVKSILGRPQVKVINEIYIKFNKQVIEC